MRTDEENDLDADSNELCLATSRSGYADRSPNVVEKIVCSVTTKSPLDELAAALDAADWLTARSKSISHLSRQIAIQWIERNGEFAVGDLQYKVGYNHVTRCTNPRQTGLQLLDDLGGDFATFLEVLVAQPFKPGSAKRILNHKVYSRLFSIKLSSRLVAGVPERSLIRSRGR